MENEINRIMDFFVGHGFVKDKIVLFGKFPVSRDDAKTLIGSGISAKELRKLFDAELYAERFIERNGKIINQEEYDSLKIEIKNSCEKYGLELSWFFEEEEMIKRMTEIPVKANKKTTKGHIYVVESYGKHKIGKTKHLHSRLKKYVTENPDEIRTVHIFSCEDIDTEESRLHKKFIEKRVRGEWFMLSEDDLKYIKSLGNV